MSTYSDDQGDTFPPPEADAHEQRQDAVDYGPPDRVSGDVDPEASEADLAEQGAPPGGHARRGDVAAGRRQPG
ncbi:hypothetical protein [Micromonospora sp. NPDC048898]|uniref:hypothetical protein n=1 Tax=Micromonospora sp. NPDC048898 TaxID=3364260 RepID=UPI003719D27B